MSKTLPKTRHPTPDTRHPTPDTRHPAPDTRHPAPGTYQEDRVTGTQEVWCHEIKSTLDRLAHARRYANNAGNPLSIHAMRQYDREAGTVASVWGRAGERGQGQGKEGV